MAFIVRKAVSKNKRRYKEKGFDLDLSYITKRLIAMGYPSENVEGVYRNPFKEVFRFLESQHKDHYKVYNLCSERSYDISKFHNRVECFPFDDHNAPTLDLIFKFCKNVQEWMNNDLQNVAVVHCKAGKGRTGLMICAYMIYSGEWNDAESALSFYAAMRTYNKKGVTIPSQLRYVRYVGEIMKNIRNKLQNVEITNLQFDILSELPSPNPLLLNKITFTTIPKVPHITDIRFSIYVFKTLIYSHKTPPKHIKIKDGKTKSFDDTILPSTPKNNEDIPDINSQEMLIFSFPSQPLMGDIKIDFYEKDTFGSDRLFAFWFNTCFVPIINENNENQYKLELTKDQLDKANKDKSHKIYKLNFKVTCFFSPLDSEQKIIVKPNSIKSGFSSKLEMNTKQYIIESKPYKISESENSLNCSSTCKSTSRSAIKVVEELLQNLIELIIKNCDDGVISQFSVLNSLENNEEFQEFVFLTAELQKVEIKGMSHDEKLTFWINLYNLLNLHSKILSNRNYKYYIVNEKAYSLEMIEFFILRNKMRNIPTNKEEEIKLLYKRENEESIQNIINNFGLEFPEPRILFALNKGEKDSPSINIMHYLHIFEELEKLTRSYLHEYIKLDKDNNKIYIPEILSWYLLDFGKNQEKMLKNLSQYFVPEIQQIIHPSKKTKKFPFTIEIIPYDSSFYYSFKHMINSN